MNPLRRLSLFYKVDEFGPCVVVNDSPPPAATNNGYEHNSPDIKVDPGSFHIVYGEKPNNVISWKVEEICSLIVVRSKK